VKNPKLQDAILADFDRCALGWETSMTYFYYQGYKPEEPWVGQFDAQVEFAREKGMSLEGDSGGLIRWFDLSPWLCTYNADGTQTTSLKRDELLSVIDNYLEATVGRHKGEVDTWYVLNELIGTTWKDAEGFRTGMKKSIWYTVIGPDYIEYALRKAHSLDPGAKLFINEGLYWSPWPSVAKERGQLFFELVSDLVKRGVPLDGIGEQMHLQTRYTNPSGEIDLSLYEPYLKRFTDLGLDVHITELDVAILGEVNEESLEKQAEIYSWAMDLVMRNKGITEITLFSLTDVVSYQHNFDSALSGEAPMNIDNVPKPAYYAMKRRLSQR
jgi:endo-1,4-beta-xylanase